MDRVERRRSRMVERAALGLLVILYLLSFEANGDRDQRIRAEANNRIDQINQERASNIERSCREVNQRHDDTIKALDRVLERRLRDPVTPAERVRIRASRESTVLLIEALAPNRPCDQLVAEQVTP